MSNGKNIIEKMGTLNRDNTNFSLYDDNPELYNQLGEKGVKFVDSPRWLSWLHQNRPFTVGNTVISPKDFGGQDAFNNAEDWSDEQLLNMNNIQQGNEYSSWGELVAKEETPHVAQYRDMGLFGFLGNYVKELFQSGGQKDMYEDEHSLEGFHAHNPEEKARLYNQIVGDEHQGNFAEPFNKPDDHEGHGHI